MDINAALFLLGACLVSAGITYAWRVKIRVVRLREDLFIVRDKLFDAADEINAFDDPAYRQARDHLNAIIGFAGTLSVPSLAYIIASKTPVADPLKTDNPRLQEAIDTARRQTAERLARYIAHETLLGLALTIVVLILPRSLFHSAANDSVARCLQTTVPEEVAGRIGTAL